MHHARAISKEVRRQSLTSMVASLPPAPSLLKVPASGTACRKAHVWLFVRVPALTIMMQQGSTTAITHAKAVCSIAGCEAMCLWHIR